MREGVRLALGLSLEAIEAMHGIGRHPSRVREVLGYSRPASRQCVIGQVKNESTQDVLAQRANHLPPLSFARRDSPSLGKKCSWGAKGSRLFYSLAMKNFKKPLLGPLFPLKKPFYRQMCQGVQVLAFGIIFLGFSLVSKVADGSGRVPRALVYQGPGACAEGCSEAAAAVATRAGLNVTYVGPEIPSQFQGTPEKIQEYLRGIFENAVIWIQPGGKSSQVSKAMVPVLKEAIRSFVSQGGGYVGFCAGGFFATAKVGTTEFEGLGILPGSTRQYTGVPPEAIEKDLGVIVPTLWTSAGGNVQAPERAMYWEGGPEFILSEAEQAITEVTARYIEPKDPTGQTGPVASVRTQFGRGRVYVAGDHPEAPMSWRNFYKLNDSDGLDLDLAVAMIRWAKKE